MGTRNSEVGGEIRTKNQFLTEMDGINGKGKNLKMYVIGATNKPWSLDWPFLRRFQKRVYISLPTLPARDNLFNLYTTPLKKDMRVKTLELAKLFDGYSASDIKDVCQSAQLKAVQELFDSPDYHEPVAGDTNLPQPKSITMSDFRAIMTRRKDGVAEVKVVYKKELAHVLAAKESCNAPHYDKMVKALKEAGFQGSIIKVKSGKG